MCFILNTVHVYENVVYFEHCSYYFEHCSQMKMCYNLNSVLLLSIKVLMCFILKNVFSQFINIVYVLISLQYCLDVHKCKCALFYT